jgi:hypothetical protein
MISYFDSKNPSKVSLEESIVYLEMAQDNREKKEFQEITNASKILNTSNLDDFVNDFASQITQNKLLPLELETLARMKNVFHEKNHYLEEVIDESIMQKAHILKALNEYSEKATKLGLNSFITKKSFENKGFEIVNDSDSKDVKKFQKNDGNLFNYSFSYDKTSNTLFTEESDIRLKNGIIEIKMRNGKMDVDIQNRSVACNLTKNRKKSLKP